MMMNEKEYRVVREEAEEEEEEEEVEEGVEVRSVDDGYKRYSACDSDIML